MRSDPLTVASTSPVTLLVHPKQQVSLVFSGVGYQGDAPLSPLLAAKALLLLLLLLLLSKLV